MTVRILVGNDHHLVLEALATTLGTVADFDVVGLAREGDSVMPVVLRTNPTVAVLGAGGAGGTAVAIAAKVLDSRPSCGVVLTAASPTRALLDHAKRTGVLGVVPMHSTLPQLVRVIRGAAIGVRWAAIDVGPSAEPSARPMNLLTDRERDVLKLTWSGASMTEISRELCLATGTVRNVSSAARGKLKARNRFDAARIALEAGWL